MSPTPLYDSLPFEQKQIIENLMQTGDINLREALASMFSSATGKVPLLHKFDIATTTDRNTGMVNRMFCLLAWEHAALVMIGAAEGYGRSLEFMSSASSEVLNAQQGKVQLQ